MTQPAAKSQKKWIRPLPEQLVNKIAAGEVVERPAAIVKELVENSLDSGATQIDIRVEKAGARLISISDNGCGIAEDQMEVAFSRHATSKISNYSDLESLITYGFRGEALPSIASVSRTRAVSRTTDAEIGVEIIVEGGVKQSLKPIAASPGTVLEVANLFFNTPARRKFLKSESTESRHINRTATALALGRPDVGFSFSSNGRSIFNLPPSQTLAERASSLLGLEHSLISLSADDGKVGVLGVIGTPDVSQTNRYSQYLFINQRYIQSPTLSHALAAGFGELLPRGRFPVGAVLLTVDPTEVDVNVHPTKTEVRLSHEREIHDYLMHVVRDSLQREGVVPTLRSLDGETRRATSGAFASGSEFRSTLPASGTGTNQSRQFLADLYRPPQAQNVSATTETISVDRRTGEIIGESVQTAQDRDSNTALNSIDLTGLRLVGKFSDLYLLFAHKDELFIIDQHTAHERVLYEQTLDEMERQAIVAQQMLLPVQVELSPEQLVVFDESEEVLNSNGFTVSHFGGRTVNIEAMPVIVKQRSPEKYFRAILDDMQSLQKSGYDLKKAMAQSIACRAAVMAGDRLSDAEAIGLVESLLRCRNKFSCPHGRPTFIKIGRSDLDRQFGRG